MRLDSKEFKLYQQLKKKGSLTPKEQETLKQLEEKKSSRNDDSSFKPGNDFSWWNKYPELMADAANLKDNYISGTNLVDDFVPTGAVCFTLQNIYGAENSVTGAINLASRNLYLKMFQKYRGITSYEAADLGMVMLASLEVFQLVAKLERIYGVINYYSVINRNLPVTVLNALGLSTSQADYIRANLANFRYDLNNIILRAQRILIPKDMSIIANKLSLYGYLYKDHDSREAQTIVFDYKLFGMFDETSFTTGSGIIFKTATEWGKSLINFTAGEPMFPLLEEMVSRLLTSESVNKIYGDLLAYFGIEQMLHMLPLPEDYVVYPVYSESIVHKMHNLECTASAVGTASIWMHTAPDSIISDSDLVTALFTTNINNPCIYQWNGVIQTLGCLVPSSTYEAGTHIAITNPAMTGANVCGFAASVTTPIYECHEKHVLDSYHEAFTPEIVTEGVLWKCSVQRYDVSGQSEYHLFLVDSAVTEICLHIDNYIPTGVQDRILTHAMALNSAYEYAAKLAMTDWAPMVYMVNIGTHKVVRVYGDLDTCRILTFNDLKRIHDCAVLSAFRSDIVVVKDANVGIKN